MDHICHVFSMEEIVGHILKFLPMKELHRVSRYDNYSDVINVYERYRQPQRFQKWFAKRNDKDWHQNG